MPFPIEYHTHVVHSLQRSASASLALFATLLFFAVCDASAQFNGSSFAATSHAASSAPPTHFYAAPPTGPVTPRTGPVAPPTAGTPHTHSAGAQNGNHQHHYATGTAYYPYVYALPVPYAVDMSGTDDAADNNSPGDDADYQAGRGGDGIESSDGPDEDADQNSYANAATAPPDVDPPQPLTTLVFRDGHQIEIGNYAIVSQTLYDLTPGHQCKISLAELDLAATEKQNDDRGVLFELPSSAQAN